jgi:hypothetical protein
LQNKSYIDQIPLVPIYDVRSVDFDLTAAVFANMDEHFERYRGELPRGAFAVAAHLTQVQKISDQHRIVVLPIWVMLVAHP